MAVTKAMLATLPTWAQEHIAALKAERVKANAALGRKEGELETARVSERNLARDNAALRRRIVQLQSEGRRNGA